MGAYLSGKYSSFDSKVFFYCHIVLIQTYIYKRRRRMKKDDEDEKEGGRYMTNYITIVGVINWKYFVTFSMGFH
jgi:hypothetical protein